MAKGIQDLGIGLGYLYKTLTDGSTIVAVEKNTKDGVRSMKSQGTTNGPLIADRPAYATITVNSVASTGAISAVTISTVNQIGSNINITTSTASVAATQIASAINSFTPATGGNFTAQAVGAVVYVFSAVDRGSATNGATITVSVTDPSIVTTTTVFSNGSTLNNGTYDNTFGYRFYIDADYGAAGVPGGGTATPSSLLYAMEITEYITVRGLQSGIVTTSSTINGNSITGLSRASAITQILVSNQASAATDTLAFLQTESFAVGDEVQLTAAAPRTQVPTVESAPVTTSPVGTPNIYLTDDTAFVMDNYTSLTLQLRNISGVGLAWVETGRSITDGVIAVTIAEIQTLGGASQLKPGGVYLITDVGDRGTYTTALSSTQISAVGMMVRAVPRGYAGCWRASMGVPAVGSKYRYYQNVYTSVTGAIGSAPDTDAVNWTVIAKTNNTYYEAQVHEVGLNTVGNLGAWPIVYERDNHNNTISQSEGSYVSMSANAYNVFAWQQTPSNTVHGNIVVDAIFDCANTDGSVYENNVLDGGKFDSNALPSGSVVAWNTISGTSTRVYGNFVTYIILNNVKNGGRIYSNGASGAYFYQIAANTVEGNITGLTSLSAGYNSVEYCLVEHGAEIKNSTFAASAQVRYTTVRSGSSITNCVFSAPGSTSNIEACEVSGTTNLTVVDGGGRLKNCRIINSTVTLTLAANPMTNVLFSGSAVTMTATASSDNSEVKSCNLEFTGSLNQAYLTDMATTGSPTMALTGVINPNGSNMYAILDLDDAGVFSAGALTVGNDNQFCGQLILSSTAIRNITSVVGLPTPFEVLFVTTSTDNITFTTTAAATASGYQFVGTAASFVIKAFASGASSMLWMAGNTITRTAVLI